MVAAMSCRQPARTEGSPRAHVPSRAAVRRRPAARAAGSVPAAPPAARTPPATSSCPAGRSAWSTVTGGDRRQGAPTVTLQDRRSRSPRPTTTRSLTDGHRRRRRPRPTWSSPTTLDAQRHGRQGRSTPATARPRAVGLDLGADGCCPGLTKSLVGEKVGSRVLVGDPAGRRASARRATTELGVKERPTPIVFVLDIKSATTPLTKADGKAVAAQAGPADRQGRTARASRPTITIPKGAGPDQDRRPAADRGHGRRRSRRARPSR